MMRFNISDLVQKAKNESTKRLGPQPGIVLTQPELEKFAELMIIECTKVVESERDPPNLNYKPSQKISESIKRHFGL